MKKVPVQPVEDLVLNRMLARPPEPHTPPKNPQKKPAKQHPKK